ncbi:transcriptional regulator Anr [Lysobacter terrae]
MARGERLYRPGAPLTAVCVASDGAFKIVSISEDGEEQVVGFHLAGELIGLDALGGRTHRYEAVALTAANVCEVPFDQLASVAAQLPTLHHQLLRVIGLDAERGQAHLGILFRKQASSRIALFLHSLSERYRNIGQSATQFKLPMSREDIARYLGLALETISRGFTKLQDDGVIESVGRRIDIRDPAALGRLAHSAENEEPRRRRA